MLLILFGSQMAKDIINPATTGAKPAGELGWLKQRRAPNPINLTSDSRQSKLNQGCDLIPPCQQQRVYNTRL